MALRAGTARLAILPDEGERVFSDEGNASACTVNRKVNRSDMLGEIKGEEESQSKLSDRGFGMDGDQVSYLRKQ